MEGCREPVGPASTEVARPSKGEYIKKLWLTLLANLRRGGCSDQETAPIDRPMVDMSRFIARRLKGERRIPDDNQQTTPTSSDHVDFPTADVNERS